MQDPDRDRYPNGVMRGVGIGRTMWRMKYAALMVVVLGACGGGGSDGFVEPSEAPQCADDLPLGSIAGGYTATWQCDDQSPDDAPLGSGPRRCDRAENPWIGADRLEIATTSEFRVRLFIDDDAVDARIDGHDDSLIIEPGSTARLQYGFIYRCTATTLIADMAWRTVDGAADSAWRLIAAED